MPSGNDDEDVNHPLRYGDMFGGGGAGDAAIDPHRQHQMARTGWWWQRGPVTSCCGCFSLRTGVYILSLCTTISGVAYLRVEKWHIPLMAKALEIGFKTYKRACTGVVVAQKQQCDEIERKIAKAEETLDFWESAVPVYHAIGAFYIFFALAGWRAGYTGNSTFAKVFMMVFPAALSLDVVLTVVSPRNVEPVHVMVWSLTFAYFFKVAWSFYARLRIAEEMARRSANGSINSGGAGIELGAPNP